MVNGKKLIKILCFLIGITSYNSIGLTMEKKPYHHLPDGTFRNPEGSPIRSDKVKFSYRQFTKEKKKIDMTVPKEHVVNKDKVKALTLSLLTTCSFGTVISIFFFSLVNCL